jgi:hypothetical protein
MGTQYSIGKTPNNAHPTPFGQRVKLTITRLVIPSKARNLLFAWSEVKGGSSLCSE